MRAVPDQIARWVPAAYTSLGTDGFGFSDTRAAARRFFHVDAESITLAVLSQLARRGEVKHEALAEAIAKYRLDDPVSDGPPPAVPVVATACAARWQRPATTQPGEQLIPLA